jgi:hypothetical protein
MGANGWSMRTRSRLSEKDAAQKNQLSRMIADAQTIQRLRNEPQRVLTSRRSDDELLAVIEDAMTDAGVPLESWRDSVPQPPRRVANGAATRMTNRLYLENVSLEAITRFAHALVTRDPVLEISAIEITAPRSAETALWSVTVAVSYWAENPATREHNAMNRRSQANEVEFLKIITRRIAIDLSFEDDYVASCALND